jgi:leucyl aminopeptidase
MDFKTHVAASEGLAQVAADGLLVVVAGAGVPKGLDKVLAALLAQAVKDGDFAFKAGQVLYAHRVAGVKAARVAFACMGEVGEGGSVKALRKAVAAGLALFKSGGAKHLALAVAGVTELTQAHAETVVTTVADGLYVYRQTKPSAAPSPKLRTLTLLCGKSSASAVASGLRRGEALASGIDLARECANLPGNHCTPGHLAAQARKLGKELGLSVQVLERKQCEKLGMGSFLAVAQGSEQPPKFIVARWNGAGKTDAPVVLVGKGITFDSGGISIKPGAEMDEMKFDMGGAASVLGTLRAVAEMGARVNLVGIIPACENLPSGRAVKPGDVVTSMSGQTIEILNTDAEGRLILCDALTYAERLKPAVVVDVATLTGACVIALGHHRSGLFSSDDALAAELLSAGESALDPAWRMPLDEEYDEGLKSNFADMANIGSRAGGSITAAMFLKRFTAKLRWAHLDIAGTAWKSGAAKGATGRPVPLLTHFVLQRAK